MTFLIVVLGLLALGLLGLAAGARVLEQHERGVQFRLGKVLDGARGPGLIIIIPFVDHVHRVSMRIITLPIQSQGIVTKDNVSIDVSTVAYYRVDDAIRSVVAIENVVAAIDQIAQTTLRVVVGRHSLDETLSKTDRINRNIREIRDVQTEEWGVKVAATRLRPAGHSRLRRHRAADCPLASVRGDDLLPPAARLADPGRPRWGKTWGPRDAKGSWTSV